MRKEQAKASLYDFILKLKRETSSITTNPLLDVIELNKIKAFEEIAKKNGDYKQKLQIIETHLKDADFIHTPKYNRAFDVYNELVVYESLNSKTNTVFVREITNKKTPDYKLTYQTYSCYADLKTIHFVNGNLNYIDVQEQSAKSKIKFDKAIRNKLAPVTFSDAVVISPFMKGKEGEHRNIQFIVEELIKKLNGLLKLEQVNYDGSEGILLIDLLNMYLPPFLELGLPVHHGSVYKELNSGILWNTVFGEIGDPTYNWVEFSGLPNIGEKLTMNGVLKESSNHALKAIMFIVGNNRNIKTIGFHRATEKNEDLLNILYRICDFVNDDVNSQYFRIDEIQ